MRTFHFHLAMTVPDTVSVGELRDYIRDAIGSWGGQRHPEDHLFRITDTQIKLRSIAAPARPEPVS